MQDRQARARSGLGRVRSHDTGLDTRINVTLAHLRKLEGQAKQFRFLPHQPGHSVLNGKHTSGLRGRGLDFEEIRGYLPSDDVRSIDWKVTARTGTPHIRVFTEERDRPTLLVVDQRMSMFFGSVNNMKSVTAAECAALAAFATYEQGDRIGGIVFGDVHITDVKPKRSKAALNSLLTAIAESNQKLRADAPTVTPQAFNKVLEAVAKTAKQNHLVFIFSDFDNIDENTHKILSSLAKRNELILGLVTDPYAQNLPQKTRMVVSDGELQAEINTGSKNIRDRLHEMAQGRVDEILAWQHDLAALILPLSCAEDSVQQMRKLLGINRIPR